MQEQTAASWKLNAISTAASRSLDEIIVSSREIHIAGQAVATNGLLKTDERVHLLTFLLYVDIFRCVIVYE
jgi:hypothetical protein